MNLGQYLVSRNEDWNDCVSRVMETGRWQVTSFNPSVVLPYNYIIDSTGRAQPNPAYYEAHILRYGMDERKINGTKTGERLPDFLSEIYPWMDRLGLERAPTQLQDRKDLLYVSNGMIPALDTLIHEMKVPLGGAGQEIEELQKRIQALEIQKSSLDAKLGDMKLRISDLVEDIDDLEFPTRGGGKWVVEVKSIRSKLFSIIS